MRSLVHLPRSARRRMRWKNDGGWTSEIAVDPETGPFDWRVSIAEIEADSEFSSFAGIDRSILVLDGAGIQLVSDERSMPTPRFPEPKPERGPEVYVGALLKSTVDVVAGGQPFTFAGELGIHARLLDGPTRDFNVMTRRGVIEHELSRRALADAMVLEPAPGRGWLVHVVSGIADIEGLSIPAGDSVLAGPDCEAGPPLIVQGTAELVLVRLDRA